MKLKPEDKKALAANASFIDERLAGYAIPVGTDTITESSNELLERWKALVSTDSEFEGFARRLEIAGKNIEEIKPLLGEISWNDEKPLPEWIKVIEEFTGQFPFSYENQIKTLPAGVISEEDPRPFQHSLLPLITLCHKLFLEKTEKPPELFMETAVAGWLRYLLNFFEKHFCLSLLSAFDLQRCKDFMPFASPSISSIPAGSRSDYDNFTKHMLAGGWLEHLKRYPVAARLIAVFCEQQSSFFAKALKDMENDISRIRESFNGGKETGRISRVESGISDQHNGGKSVIKYEFEHGLKLLYKPRSSMIDLLWEKTLEWCGAKTPDFKFKTPVHLEGENCCWAENIENDPLDSKADAADFYYRAGGILALIYILGGTDFHQENLIAQGAYPVLIDLETILRPLVRPFSYEELTDEHKKLCESLEGDSVIRTCIVPMWMPVSKEVSRDYGALTPDDNSAYSTREWLDINTDRMRRGRVDRKTNPSPNAAHFNGELMIVSNFKKELIKGFCDIYGLVSNNRAEFTGANGPLKHFSETTMRFLPRNSQVYADMIDRLRSPSLLRSGAAFSIEVEGLSKSFLNGVPAKDIEKLWKIFDAERRSLLFLNIPLFEFNASNEQIFDHTGEICPDYYLKTAIEEAERRAAKLSAEDMSFQCDLIEASISCRYPKDQKVTAAVTRKTGEENRPAPALAAGQYLEEAGRIAKNIADRSVIRSGKPQWLTIKFDPVKNHSYIGPVDYTLYEGTAGIGLFLAAYEHASGDKTHHGLALNCFSELEELIENKKAAEMSESVSVGYAGGFMGALTALYNAGFYMAEEKLCVTARKGLALLSVKAIEKDPVFDIIGGAAGGLMTALAFNEVHGDGRLIEFADKCGHHLLNSRFDFEKRKLWPSSHAYKPLTGFAHGSAGYAAALLKLYGLTGNGSFKEAAVAAVDYEKTCFVQSQCNWPDFRINRDLAPGETAYMGGWCSGAPGIGMARLATLNIIDNDEIKKDIGNAVSFTENFRDFPGARDHLCCGYAGRIDFLIEASRKLEKPELISEAGRQMSFVISRAEARGKYTFSVDDTRTVFTPGLFTGLSGIGYTALRMAAPEKILTVLAPEVKR